ncbi:glycosyltransferase [Mariniflexile sp. AS56]|uniref:glycosyltransferase n=1 Tax=Mariniflexile sp. AS56 TaxID=3063957 RepID=UPI0026E97E81|nr:glycosyltransferase [Mariniflexile sp. AS56]MDO7172733.1 glycosyltransferase [Mariniflexile sp. AS56]
MRIVHISTFVSGGAGLAAYRLHATMLKNNLDSVLYSQSYNNPNQSCFQVKITRPKGIISRSLNYLFNKLANIINAKYNRFSFEYHSNIRTLYRMDKFCKKNDIIILHWVAGFLDYKSFFSKIDKDSKVFIYVHDFNTIQGKLHTLFDREKIRGTSLEKIENYYQSKKKGYYNQLNNLKIIANSSFTEKILIQSNFFSKESIFKVQLGLPVDELKSMEKKLAKKHLGFEKHDFLILICSHNLESELKGFDRIMKIFNKFKNHPNIKFIGLGKLITDSFINKDNFFCFETWDPEFKSKLFSASDVTFSASYEETFGQTIIESYACSTPVIVYNNSALPELVSHHETGFIAENDNDVIGFINLLLTDSDLKEKMNIASRNLFLMKYTSENQLNKLRELLNNKISSKC